jgi:hypothetical protein
MINLMLLRDWLKEIVLAKRKETGPISIAEAIANKAIPDMNVALRIDEPSSLPDVECTMKRKELRSID